jgi:hypothetical protein
MRIGSATGRVRMASQEQLDKQIARTCELAREISDSKVLRLDIHLQDSGEFPYQLTTTDEQYPIAGMASGTPASDPEAESASSEAASGKEGHSNG